MLKLECSVVKVLDAGGPLGDSREGEAFIDSGRYLEFADTQPRG